MRRFLLILPLLAGLSTASLKATEPVGPISFELGVDYSRICTQIDDKAACESSNMYGDRVGGASTRNGSHRMNSTAVSTNPFSALYSGVVSTNNAPINVFVGVSGDTIYYSTDDVFTRWSVLYKGLNTPNQKFSFAQAQNSVYMTGDALTDPIFKWDVTASTFNPALVDSSSSTAMFYAKYLLYEGGYMFAGNTRDVKQNLPTGTTYYDDQIMYSYLLQPSSFTVDHVLNLDLGDGESLTGITSKRSSEVGKRIVMAYKQSSAHSISFSVLSPAGLGGDQLVTKVAHGFGHIADSPPENIGAWDVLLSKDGILLWNGGLLARANLEAEKIVISRNIKPVIDMLIKNNTYRSAILKHYAKSNYIVFAYEDPNKFPRGRPNSSMYYDLLTGEWWPMKNQVIGSLETDKGKGATGTLMYGDGMDGYVHVWDDQVDTDDSRKEISLDAMEKTDGWAGAGISTNVVAVGTASLSLSLTGSVRTSSITKVFVMPMGEFYDKSQSSGTDKLSFKVYASSLPFLSQLRIDLEVKDVQGQFDTNFSSVVITSATLTGGSSYWNLVEIALSSFTIRNDWIDFTTESIPFARNLTRFGVRFVATGTQGLTLYFDDLRVVQGSKNPLNPERFTKRFNFGTLADKDWQQIVLSREKQRDGVLYIDVLTGQGQAINTVIVNRETPQELFICGYSSAAGIAKLSSIDFNVLAATITNVLASDYHNGAADAEFVYAFDSQNNRIAKMARNALDVIVSSFGALGSCTTCFNYVQEIAVETKKDGNLLIVDHMNHRLKEHKKSNLSFVRQFGQLGYGATSFYNPTGADWDAKYIYVLDDSNQAIKKFTRAYEFVSQATLDINTVGNGSIRVGSEYLFLAYNRGSNNAIYYIDVILEKRRKSDLSLVSRVVLRPESTVADSTYSLRGSIALHSKFVYVSFNDNSLVQGNFYFHKRLQSDLSLVDEVASHLSSLGVIGDNLMREPATDMNKRNLKTGDVDPYVQLRFYTKDVLENPLKLSEMAITAVKNEYTATEK